MRCRSGGEGARARIGTLLLWWLVGLRVKRLVLDLRLGIKGGIVRVLDLGVLGRGLMRLMTCFVAPDSLQSASTQPSSELLGGWREVWYKGD